ncbi:MAG: regulatory protein RecX [Actinomycetaceae bacterium]|nr:recombination regulator RecX [Arcanobacterium sp.]MDD7504844.1 regulatory protein RecX [Actinomycetaceae bacterium]MDY6142790.1 regulatory protein RecX [Arcanobacterium sp.]
MVDYSEGADSSRRSRPRYRSKDEIEARRRARNAARSESDWRAYARDICYRQLSAMDRSTFQLREAMVRRDVPELIIEDTVAAFVEADLVDDERFALTFVRLRAESRPCSRRSLLKDLRERGIAGDLAQRAVESIDENFELESARNLAQKKMRSLAGVDRHVARRRLYGALARRGFAPNIVVQVLNEVASAESDADGASPSF